MPGLLREYVEKLDRDDLIFLLNEDADMDAPIERPFLLITHGLTRTGAPNALLDMACVLKDSGYTVFLLSASDGDLLKDVLISGIHALIYPNHSNDESFMRVLAELFDSILVNTFMLSPVIRTLAPISRRVFWWIHESEFVLQWMPELCENIPLVPSLTILAANPRIQDTVTKYLGCSSEELRFFIEDSASPSDDPPPSPIRFLQVGTVDNNKGQDILAAAIRLLPESVRNLCDFTFCGNKDSRCSDVLDCIRTLEQGFDNVHFVDFMPRARLYDLYDSVHVIVVPSYMETTSIVAVEGLMKGKVCICSDGCGICEYLTDGENAFIFDRDDVGALAGKIRETAENYAHLRPLRTSGRKVYEQYYTREVFKKRLLSLL